MPLTAHAHGAATPSPRILRARGVKLDGVHLGPAARPGGHLHHLSAATTPPPTVGRAIDEREVILLCMTSDSGVPTQVVQRGSSGLDLGEERLNMGKTGRDAGGDGACRGRRWIQICSHRDLR